MCDRWDVVLRNVPRKRSAFTWFEADVRWCSHQDRASANIPSLFRWKFNAHYSVSSYITRYIIYTAGSLKALIDLCQSCTPSIYFIDLLHFRGFAVIEVHLQESHTSNATACIADQDVLSFFKFVARYATRCRLYFGQGHLCGMSTESTLDKTCLQLVDDLFFPDCWTLKLDCTRYFLCFGLVLTKCASMWLYISLENVFVPPHNVHLSKARLFVPQKQSLPSLNLITISRKYKLFLSGFYVDLFLSINATRG